MRALEIDCVGMVKLTSVLREAKAYSEAIPRLGIGGQLNCLEECEHYARAKREEELCGTE